MDARAARPSVGSGRGGTRTERGRRAHAPRAVLGLAALAALTLALASFGGATASQSAGASSPGPTISASSGETIDGALACPADGSCISMSYDATDAGLTVDSLSGSSWSSVAIALPAGAGNAAQQLVAKASINGLACLSPTSCTGVGTVADTSGNVQALLVSGYGTSWQAVTAALPPGAVASAGFAGELDAIACTASACEAAGEYEAPAGRVPLVLSGAGASWTDIAPALPADSATSASASISSLGCSFSTCLATGRYLDSGATYEGLLVAGSGTSFTASTAPVPAGGTFADLDGAACGLSSCTAVGAYYDVDVEGLIISSSGSTATAVEAPLPPGAVASATFDEAALTAVACASTSCTVVGNYDVDNAGNTDGLVLTGSGTSYAVASTPVPSDAAAAPEQYTVLSGVACTTGGSCVPEGSYDFGPSEAHGLVLTGAGTSWYAASASLPGGSASTSGNALLGVACQPGATCVAAGDYVTGANPTANLGLLDTVGLQLASPTVALALSTSAAALSGSVTATVAVTGSSGEPAGSVTVDNGAIPITSCGPLPLSGQGTASCAIDAASLGSGSHVLTAHYAGDPGYEGASSPSATLVVASSLPSPGPVSGGGHSPSGAPSSSGAASSGTPSSSSGSASSSDTNPSSSGASSSGATASSSTTTTLPAATAVVAPAPVAAVRSIDATNGAVARLELACSRATCVGALTISARLTTVQRVRQVVIVRHVRQLRTTDRRSTRIETIGTSTYRIDAGKSLVAIIHLSSGASAALLAATTHRLGAEVTVTPVGGATVSEHLSIDVVRLSQRAAGGPATG